MSYLNNALLVPNWDRWIDRALQVEPANLIALWPLNDLSGAVARSITRRSPNILLNGGFEVAGAGGADVLASWVENAGDGTIERTATAGEFHGGAAACKITTGATTGASGARASQAIAVIPGATYELRFATRGDGTNAGRYRLYNPTYGDVMALASTGVTGADFGEVVTPVTVPAGVTTLTILFYGPAVNGGWACFDDVQVLAPAHTNPFNGSIVGADVAKPGIGDGTTAMWFDGVGDYINIWSPALANAFNGNEGTLLCWAKVANAGVWGDGQYRRVVHLGADAQNYLLMYRNGGVANLIRVGYVGGGTIRVIDADMGGTLGWFPIGMTWTTVPLSRVWGYFRGTQSPLPITDKGVFVGQLGATTALIGAASTTPTQPWSGSLGPCLLFDKALSPEAVAYLSRLP